MLVKEYVPAVEFLKNFDGKILLASHENPDGDTVGSALALYHFLKKKGKNVKLGCKDPIPYFLAFLPGAEDYIQLPTEEEFDLVVVVDASSVDRLGAPVKGKQFMRIDHHKGGDFYCECDLIEVDAPATAKVVYYLLSNWDPDAIDETIATCIFTGLATDTGFFINPNTNGKVFQLASLLVDKYGVNPHYVAENIRERNPLRRLKLLSKALESIRLENQGKVAVMYVLQDWLDELGAQYADTESFVNYARSIDGVEVAIFILEKAKEGVWKVSLRSKGNFDVSVVCEQFGGGGHKYAAGCKFSLEKPLEEVINNLLKEIEKRNNL